MKPYKIAYFDFHIFLKKGSFSIFIFLRELKLKTTKEKESPYEIQNIKKNIYEYWQNTAYIWNQI